MEFLDPKKRRAYNIRLFIGFFLITVALILGTTILALITAGYNIDRKTGQVIQNGLVFLNSQPTSATIYINGSKYGTTNARLELNAGNYSFALEQKNYHSWSNTITLNGGEVEQLIYPFLFPLNPVGSNALSIASEPQMASASPDRHHMLVSVPDQPGGFNVVDLNNIKTPITSVSIPAGVLGAEPGTNILSVVEWSNDNQHVLLKDSYQGGVQYIMFDWVTPADSFNVNQTFPDVTFTDIKLDNKAFDKLYLFDQTSGSLVLADSTAKTTTPVLSGVLAYWPYSNNEIVYTTAKAGSTTSVAANIWLSGGKTYHLRDLPVGTNYFLNIASYNGNSYIVVASSGSRFGYIYMNALNQLTTQPNVVPLPDTLLVMQGLPEDVTFSTSARFIAMQSGSQFSVYDLQTQTHYRYDSGQKFATGQLATWMDGNRLDAIINGKLTVWDFDGTNQVNLVAGSSDFLPAFNQGYDAVYTIIPSPNNTLGAWQVERNSLIAGKS